MSFFNKEKPGQIQEQLQLRLKGLDDVFHNTIIALERLELFIESDKDVEHELSVTAMNSDRDLHNDNENPPSLTSLHSELNTQCLALFFQTNFDKDQDTFQKVVKFFLEDMFTWYGGRNASIASDDVEKYFLPISAAINRQVKSAAGISKIIQNYIVDLDDISKLSDAEKEQATIEGFTALNRAKHLTEKRMKVFMDNQNNSGAFEFTSHKRGTVDDGIKRLLSFYIDFYDTQAPVDTLIRLALNYFPDSHETIIQTLLEKLKKQPKDDITN